MRLYPLLFKHVLVRLDAERAHHLAAFVLGVLGRFAPVRGLLRRALGPRDPVLKVEALGLTFPSPLGVAAGTDKDGTWFEGLGAIGFGFVEVGTVTALRQEGKPRPRVWRLPDDRGLVNAMGFPNPGADAVAPRLAARSGEGIVGVNIGKSLPVPLEDAAADYRAAAAKLAPHADFVVINVSSPNTAGLRDLQAVEQLQAIVEAVGSERPVLVKLSPDLSDEALDELADFALESGIAGIVATNTTISLDGLTTHPGGVSGAPLKARSLEVLKRLHARVGDGITLISVGGVEDADDVWERLEAGAALVQAYTGFVYGGPLWAKRVNDELARRMRDDVS